MVVLIFNNPLLDDCITGLPIDDSLETRWLRASHNTHQNQTRMGLHEEIPYPQQEIGVAAVQTNQDTGTVDDASGVPPYLKRKLLMRHDATDSDKTSRASCTCASGGKMAILDDTSTVSDDGDWIHSDYSRDDDVDEDEDEAQRQPELGVRGVGPTRHGEFPPRVRWLRRKHLHLLTTRRMATMKCAHWRHNDHDGAGKVTVTAVPGPPVLARPQTQILVQDSPPPRSGKRKRNDTETVLVRSEMYNRNRNDDDDSESDLDELTWKRQRFGSCHSTRSAPAIIQRVEDLGGLPDHDGACEVAQLPITITRRLSEASALSVGPRRSRRIREKLGSACVTTRMS